VEISTLSLGLVNTTGICGQRAMSVKDGVPIYGQPDRAYQLTQRAAILTVSTNQVFQNNRNGNFNLVLFFQYFLFSWFCVLEGFPDDFFFPNWIPSGGIKWVSAPRETPQL